MTMIATASRETRFFINRNFALLWWGQAISILGDYIFKATLVLWISTRIAAGQPWAPLAVSGALTATAAAIVLIGPVAGVFVDRWDKRRLMLSMDTARAVLNILLIMLANNNISLPFVAHYQLTAFQQLGIIYIFVFLVTTCSQFFDPSAIAVLGRIVTKEDLTRATSREQTTTGLATILGLSLSAPIFLGLGVQWALLLNALSFAISFTTVFFIRFPPATTETSPKKKSHFFQEFRGGLHFYVHNTTLVTILVATGLFMIGAGTFNALNIFFIVQDLHAPAALYSYVNALLGVGAIGGAIVSSRGAKYFGPENMFWFALLLSGLLLLIYARTTSPAFAFIIVLSLGIPNAIINAMLSPLLLTITPSELIGRVVTVLNPTVNLLRILSMIFVGYLDSTALRYFQTDVFDIHFKIIDTIFTAAGLLTIVGGLYALIKLRKEKGKRDFNEEIDVLDGS